jgi:hypothetical protein
VRRGVHPTFGEVTVSQLLATWVVHDLNHLGQTVKTMAKQYREAVGPWREFRPILDAPWCRRVGAATRAETLRSPGGL